MLAAMLSVSGLSLTDAEKKILESSNPLGVSLFARNIDDKKQLKNLVKNIKTVIGRDDVLIAVDQEGGRVRRLKNPEWSSYLAQSELFDEKMVKYHTQLIAKELKEVGINWNYAPVLDVLSDNTTDAIKCRCFCGDEKVVEKYGRIMIEEYIKAGICPCVKHIPGHGCTDVDSHLHLPVLNKSLKELEKDFYPFVRLAKETPAAMTAHVLIKELDDKPVTQSKKIIKSLIRGYMGFDGLLISDAIDMLALGNDIGQKTKASIEAGCDCVCYCSGIEQELYEVVENAGKMSDKSMERFYEIKKLLKNQNKLEKNAESYYDFVDDNVKYDKNYDMTEVLNLMQKKGS